METEAKVVEGQETHDEAPVSSARKPALARYLQNIVLREDNTAVAFAAQKYDATKPRNNDPETLGSFVPISKGPVDYRATPFSLFWIASKAIRDGLKPMIFFNREVRKVLYQGQEQEQISCYLNITATDDAPATAAAASSTGETKNPLA